MNNKDIMDELEEEEWKRLEEQIAALFDEEEEEEEFPELNFTTVNIDRGKQLEKRKGYESDATADRANETGREEGVSNSANREERRSRHPQYSECTCGYKGCNIPLKSHSDWCDYRAWRLHEDKRKEYEKINIWF